MNTLLPIFILSIICICLLVIIFMKKKGNNAIPIVESTAPAISTPEEDEIGCNLAIFDENGFKILESRSIESMPTRGYNVESSGSAINRVKHIAADLFKGATSIPNKSVEIIFKPEIQQGLADGTYTLMKTKSGEVLADAINSNGTIVGKGRLIQGGKARQLASGAFQLVSIAVAQSHLADIERSLSAIKDSISEVIERQENEDKARITGAFDYLHEIAIYMRELRCPDELTQQKRNVIEGIIKDSYSWRNKLEEDMVSLTNQISSIKDLDTFGTGDTFERLKYLIERINPLLKRRELFLNLASAINFVTTYLDPTQREFSKIDINNIRWTKLIENFRNAIMDRESKLMSTAFWNSNETLQLRKDKLRSLTLESQRYANDQQSNYLSLQNSLDASMARLIDPNGNIHVAIAFNGQGEVNSAAII
ncbi:hypothetical protein ACFOSS_04540 [Pseudaeromonas sharmana]|uniref:Uncharacterized protein n=1 Tax=Pseudaeromonas sharmana TaxID=328412 RepID=A0ABV8CL60_9GAMM